MIKAVLFDMDGVLANVGSSYRMAIIETAKKFGVNITLEEISIEKKKGNANNDWILSKRLIESKRLVAAGKNSKVPIEEVSFEVSLEEVTQVFEEIYQGTLEKPGLCETESLIPSRGFLEEIKRRCHGKIAVVTGRPRKDCQKFLVQHNINDLFDVQICMEDGPCKPSPIPVQLACKQLNVEPSESIMIGDTPDDIIAGVTAGATSWGVFTPEEDARITLGLISLKESMYDYLTKSGAVGVMKPGMLQMLDIIPSIDPITIFKKERERIGYISRATKETSIEVTVKLDGTGQCESSSGIGFLDHMISQFSKHGRFDIALKCKGDLHVDDHHTSEDCGLALGEAVDMALGDRANIRRFGSAYSPLDEALSRAVVDISSRPHAVIDLQLTREMIGTISAEMLKHFLESFAMKARITLHVHNIHGTNNHHKVESSFKALGVSFRQAVSKDETAGIPSTKGVLA